MSGIVCALAGSSGANLTSVTFTANGTWVAPTGVSNVISASGKGAPGVSDYVGNVYSGQYYVDAVSQTQGFAPYGNWANLYASYTTGLSQIAKTYPAYGPSVFLYFDLYLVDSASRWSRSLFSPADLSGTYITGYTATSIGSPATSGNMVYSSLTGVDGWGISISGYIAGGAGASSTALGQTFPGGGYSGTYPNGTGTAATTTTFTNVAVTPGNSYSIVVPSGGTVTLQYYS